MLNGRCLLRWLFAVSIALPMFQTLRAEEDDAAFDAYLDSHLDQTERRREVTDLVLSRGPDGRYRYNDKICDDCWDASYYSTTCINCPNCAGTRLARAHWLEPAFYPTMKRLGYVP